MWLATKHGFYSIVQKESGVFHLRGRVRKDLAAIRKAAGFENWQILEDKSADYRFRIIFGPEEIRKVFRVLADSIDYRNFKDSIATSREQADKLHAYHRVWDEIRRATEDTAR